MGPKAATAGKNPLVKRNGHAKGEEFHKLAHKRMAVIDANLGQSDSWIATKLKQMGLYSPKTNHGDIEITVRNYRNYTRLNPKM